MLFVGMVLCAITAVDSPSSAPVDLTTIRLIVVQNDGRCMPLDTMTRDWVNSITGTTRYQQRDPVEVFLSWTFEPEAWKTVPMVPIRNAELRKELELPTDQEEFSYDQLMQCTRLQELSGPMPGMDGGKRNPLTTKVKDISGRINKLKQVFEGQAIRMIPNSDDPLAAWGILTGEGKVNERIDAVRSDWNSLRKAFLAGDGVEFESISRRLAESLQSLPTANRPTPQQITTELTYNEYQPFHWAWKLMVLAAVCGASAMGIRRTWFDGLAFLLLLTGWGILTWGLWLRWQVAGRIPASNMYESLLFLSWGAGAFAIVAMLFRPHRLIPLTASFLGAVALVLVEEVIPLDRFVRPIAPVLLDTYWMSIHVPITMMSYSVLALAVLIAHIQIVGMAILPRRTSLHQRLDALHHWYIHIGSILLFAGIATGSMWAASSWGRYWGWDPKEVWSLIAFLGYLTILHVAADRGPLPWYGYVVFGLLVAGMLILIHPRFDWVFEGVLFLILAIVAMGIFVAARGLFATTIKSILAFWMIIMTYLGVNYVLGTGLHSYGFGGSGVAWWMLRVGAADVTLLTVCAVVYGIRSRSVRTSAEATIGS